MNKGQISYIEPIFTLLLAGVLAGAIAVILPGQVTKIRPEIEANEFENGAIILANSLLGDNSLIYFNVTYHRGVFDADKLNNLLFKKGSFTELYRCKPSADNCAINTYPGSYALIVITDIEDNGGWFTGANKLAGSGDVGSNIAKCFMSKTEMGADGQGKLFEDSDLTTLLELDKCSLRRHSRIMNLGFPVAIRYSDSEIHTGLLKVLVVE